MKQVLIACVAVVAFAVPGVALSAHHAQAATTTYTADENPLRVSWTSRAEGD